MPDETTGDWLERAGEKAFGPGWLDEDQEPNPEHAHLPLGIPLGIHERVPDTVYHGRRGVGVISKSALDRVHRSPAHYRAWLEAPSEDTPALKFGRAFHSAVLEPDVYERRYAVKPDFGDCRRKENKARRDAWRQANAGLERIGEDEDERIRAMMASVYAHPLASKLVTGGSPELTITWRDPETGLYGKSRADNYIEDHGGLVVDLKSCQDASVDEFAKSVARYRYHVQDALYRYAFGSVDKPVKHFILVAVEKEPPYAVGVHTLDTDGIARGYTAARQDMDMLAHAVRTDTWEAFPHLNTIELPRWA